MFQKWTQRDIAVHMGTSSSTATQKNTCATRIEGNHEEATKTNPMVWITLNENWKQIE